MLIQSETTKWSLFFFTILLFGITGMLFAVPTVAVGRVWLIHLLDKSNTLHE